MMNLLIQGNCFPGLRILKNKKKGASLRVVYNKNGSEIDQTSSDWYQALICATDIDRGYHSASRNNALMTLALANYASGRPIEDAYDELDQFNSNLVSSIE